MVLLGLATSIVVWQSDHSFVWIESYFNKSNALLNAWSFNKEKFILLASYRKLSAKPQATIRLKWEEINKKGEPLYLIVPPLSMRYTF